MQPVRTRFRDSAAVLVTRGVGAELEVLLVRRAPTLAFFGGWWAFPGGVVDRRLDGEAADDGGVELRCARRELFEETGLASPVLRARSASERDDLRRRLLSGDVEAAEWLAADGEVADDWCRAFARVTTPPFGPRRYRTCFVRVEAEHDFEPEILPGELVDGRFVRPAAALESWRRGELSIVPPVHFLLEKLADAELEHALTRAAEVCERVEAGRLFAAKQAPGVVTFPLLTPTLPPATTTNCHLAGEERVVIVDPATWEAGEQARLFAVLDELRAEGRELAAVVATHHHHDHVGAVAPTAERYHLPILGHPLTLERLPSTTARRVPLEDGGEIALGHAPDGSPDWRLTALHTPGHDRGHLVLRDSRYRWVLAGDLVSTVSTIVIDPPEGHLATYLASLERVLEEGCGAILPAHGPPHLDGPGLLRGYLAHRADREAALLAALDRGLTREEELTRAVYDDVDPGLHGLASRSLAAGLEKLADEKRVELGASGWVPRGR
jgi:glyoxylase-like metal-dependent hydrolase (beta-lactamase superfamily II)/8-oxo-dGTP pyrophosphatase MutT (NUDIX family)